MERNDKGCEVMRLHLKNINPKIHGLIVQHKAKSGFNNLDDTVASLIQLAMVDYPDKIKRFEINDEGDLCNQILTHVDKLTCVSCGETLILEQSIKSHDKLGTIHLDPGSRNYPHEPDEPAGIYFECVNCSGVSTIEP